MASAKTTTNHNTIRRWVEARGGYPASVKRTARKGDPGVLRIDYPGFSGEKTLKRIDWDTWFEWFDRDHLAFLYEASRDSRFSKLVKRSARASSRATPAKKTTTKSAKATKASAKTTTSHNVIKRWVEARGGYPARVKRSGRGKDPGILRIDYPGFSGEETLERIEWDEFFDWFDRDKLAFLYQDSPRSRFSKLVRR